jgi:hypothetical protein
LRLLVWLTGFCVVGLFIGAMVGLAAMLSNLDVWLPSILNIKIDFYVVNQLTGCSKLTSLNCNTNYERYERYR